MRWLKSFTPRKTSFFSAIEEQDTCQSFFDFVTFLIQLKMLVLLTFIVGGKRYAQDS